MGFVEMCKKIAFVPMVGLPSTEWVGDDIADYLATNHEVVKLKGFDDSFEADYVFIIKIIPSISWLLKQKEKGVKLIYIPVDYFSATFKFVKEATKLSLFDAICTHNSRLDEYLARYNSRIFFIDHYLKYHLNPLPEYKESGFVLWVGHLEYLPQLIIELNRTPLIYPVKCLADLENFEAFKSRLIDELNAAEIKPVIERISSQEYLICGLVVEQWSEVAQAEAMTNCKAAIDTKKNSFTHNHKPPTKAQKYIFNTIPFAIAKHSYSHQYFKEKGLNIPSIDEQDVWFSQEYYDALRSFVNDHGSRMTLEYVAASYIEVLDKVDQRQEYTVPNLVLLQTVDLINLMKAAFLKLTRC
jgi:hypothetical protein